MINNVDSAGGGADALPRESAGNEGANSTLKRKEPEPKTLSDCVSADEEAKYKMLEYFELNLKKAKLDGDTVPQAEGVANASSSLKSNVVGASVVEASVVGASAVEASAVGAGAVGGSVTRAVVTKTKRSSSNRARKPSSTFSLATVVDPRPERVVCSIVEGPSRAVRYFRTAQEAAECLSVRVDKVLTVLRGIRQSLNGLAFRYEYYQEGDDPAPNDGDCLTVEQVVAVASGAKGVRGVAAAVDEAESELRVPTPARPRRPPAPAGSVSRSAAVGGTKSANPFGCKAVRCIDPESGQVLKQFESIAAASRLLNVGSSQLSACCLGKIDSAYGLLWKFDTGNIIPRAAVPVPLVTSSVVHELTLLDLPGLAVRIPVTYQTTVAAPAPTAVPIPTLVAGDSTEGDADAAKAPGGAEAEVVELRERIRAFRASGQVGAGGQRRPQPQAGYNGSKVVECLSLPGGCCSNAEADAASTRVLHRFKTVNEAARLLGVGHSQILKCCRGQASSAYGFFWRYRDLPLPRRVGGDGTDADEGSSPSDDAADDHDYEPVPIEELMRGVKNLKAAQAEAELEAQRQLHIRSVSCLYAATADVSECRFSSIGEASSLLKLTARHIHQCCNLNEDSPDKLNALMGLRFFFTPDSDVEAQVTVDTDEVEVLNAILKRHSHKSLFSRYVPGDVVNTTKSLNPVAAASFQVLCLAHGDSLQTVIYRFASVSSAERELKIAHKKISMCCRGELEQVYGLRFVYVADVGKGSSEEGAGGELSPSAEPGPSVSASSECSTAEAAAASKPSVVEQAPIVIDESKFIPLSDVQAIVRTHKRSNAPEGAAVAHAAASAANFDSNGMAGSSSSNGSHPVCCSDASDPSDKIIYQFSSIGSASRELRVSSRRISSCCKGEEEHVFGLKFRYASDVMEPCDESNLLPIDDLLAIVELYKPASVVYSSQPHAGKRCRRFVRRSTGQILHIDLHELSRRRKESMSRRVDCFLPEFCMSARTAAAAVLSESSCSDEQAGALVPTNASNTLLKTFPDALEAAAQMRLPHSAIVDCCVFEEMYGVGSGSTDGRAACGPGSIFFGGFWWRFSPEGSDQSAAMDAETDEPEEYELCTIILCDGCNDEFPLESVGLKAIPHGDWYCISCRRSLEEPNIASEAVSNGKALEITYQDRDHSQFCALSGDAMMKLKTTLAPPTAFQRGWTPGARKSGVVYYQLFFVCEEKPSAAASDSSDPLPLLKNRYTSARDAIASCTYIPTEVDVVNLCIYGGLDMKGNSWTFEREVLEPDLQSSSEEESEPAPAVVDNMDADEEEGSRSASRLLRPKRMIAPPTQTKDFADVKPITLHGTGGGKTPDNSNTDAAMFGCAKSSKYSVAVGNDYQVSVWPETKPKEDLESELPLPVGNCIYNSAGYDDSDSDASAIDSFLVDATKAQLIPGALVHCYVPADTRCNSDGAGTEDTVERQYSKLVVVVPATFSLEPELVKETTPGYLTGYISLLNTIYGGSKKDDSLPVPDEQNCSPATDDTESSEGVGSIVGSSSASSSPTVPSASSACGDTAVFNEMACDVVRVFDGRLVSCVAISRLSAVLAEEKVLEIYKACEYDSQRACDLVRRETLSKVYSVQWSYFDLCYYIAARNYYSTGAHKLPNFPSTCNYLVQNYTFMDTWDRLVALSLLKPAAADHCAASIPAFTRSLPESIEFHFKCMNRASDFVEETTAFVSASSEVEPFDSAVTTSYLYIFSVADAIKRELMHSL